MPVVSKLKARSTNLINTKNIVKAVGLSIEYIEEDVKITQQTSTTYNNIYFYIGPVDKYKGKTLTFKGTAQGDYGVSVFYAVYGSADSPTTCGVNGAISETKSLKFTVPEEATGDLLIRVLLQEASIEGSSSETLKSFQLEEGTTVGEYKPYYLNVNKFNSSTIRNININGIDYHFANKTECDGNCEDAVNEPLIDLKVKGNSIQQTYTGKNLFDIPEITGSTNNISIPCNITKNIIVSCQESPTSIRNTSDVETSIWRFQFNSLSGKMQYTMDAHLRGQSSPVAIKATEADPIIEIIYRGIYIKEGKYSGIQIEYGNSITEYEPYVGGRASPNISYPQKIYNVGERTKNIADLSMVKTSTTTQHVRFNYDTATGTIEYTSTPTQYDYLMIYLERDVGYTFEQGKTYYWGADVTISGKTTNTKSTIYFGISYENSSMTGKTHIAYENKTLHMSGSFVYEGQTNIRLILHANYGSEEPAWVKYENIFVSEVDEFEPYGYKIPIQLQANNLFDFSVLEQYYIISNNNITVTGGNTMGWANMKYLQLKPLTTYTLTLGNEADIDIRSPDYNVRLFRGVTTSATFITDEIGHTCLKIFSPGNTTYPYNIGFIQLEEGSSTTYPITHNIYLKEPLRKIGDYADYIDYKNKKIIRNIASDIITEVKTKSSASGIYNVFGSVLSKTPYVVGTTGPCMSTHFGKLSSAEYWGLGQNHPECITPYISGAQVNYAMYSFLDPAITTVELAQQAIGTGFEILYVLKEPIEESINTPDIVLEDGINKITTSTSVEANIQATYWKQI